MLVESASIAVKKQQKQIDVYGAREESVPILLNPWLPASLSPCFAPWVFFPQGLLLRKDPWSTLKGKALFFCLRSPTNSSIVIGTLNTLWPIAESGHYFLFVTWFQDTTLLSRANEMLTGELKNNNNFGPFGWEPLKALYSNSLRLISGSPISLPVSILRALVSDANSWGTEWVHLSSLRRLALKLIENECFLDDDENCDETWPLCLKKWDCKNYLKWLNF